MVSPSPVTNLNPTLLEHWSEICHLFKESFGSSFRYSLATVNEDGTPHVTPIGSLILCEPGRGFYFEIFTKQLPKNAQINRKASVLAVNTSNMFWLRSLLGGQFKAPPAIRLTGTLGERRKATEEEKDLWKSRIRHLKIFSGYQALWGNLPTVRDIYFESYKPVNMGTMTQSLMW